MALHNQNPKSENSTICTPNCFTISSSSPPISSGESVSGHNLIQNIIIAAVSVSSAILFLVITYYTVLIRRRTRRTDPPAGENLGPSDLAHGDADYHVWRLRTVGLEESAINSIPAKPYVAGSGSASDCSVCLGDFSEGEVVRFLPVCGHAFHVLCIDTWLRAHISCPLCRASIVDADVAESFEEGEFSSVIRVLNDFEESVDVDAGDLSLDCVESSSVRDRVGLAENASGDETRFDLVDSLPESDLSFRFDREERLEDGDVVNKGKIASGSIEERERKKVVDSGGGSSSGSGKIFFFSRYGRSRSSPVLPT